MLDDLDAKAAELAVPDALQELMTDILGPYEPTVYMFDRFDPDAAPVTPGVPTSVDAIRALLSANQGTYPPQS